MDYAERAAQHILETLIPGVRMAYRPDQSMGGHDFDLTYSDGTTVPVEVTASMDPEQVQTYAAIRKQGESVPRQKCRMDWLVHPLPGANIKRIRAEIDAYLADVEADGLSYVHTHAHEYMCQSVDRLRQDLGVESAGVVKWKQPGIRIGYPGTGGAVGAECAVEAVNLEAHKDDNRRKLAATGAPARHLFVYVDALNFLPWVGVRDFDPAGLAPSLPEEITDVWAAAGAGRPTQYHVWRGDSTGWRHAETVVMDDEG
jgi:hypothetical protein